MPRGGLFELRKDSITGWWVAVVVDREFDRSRFHKPAKHAGATPEECLNCNLAAGGDGVQQRMLKPDAFILAGTERDARESQLDGREPELGLLGDSGSWQTIVAPRGHHESFAETSPQIAFELLARARDVLTAARIAEQTEYLAGRSELRPPGWRADRSPVLRLLRLPHIPHRIGEELGGAARYVIREGGCPFCHLVRDEASGQARLVFEDSASVCFAPYASRSPFELWVVPRHHDADFGSATDSQLVSAAETLQSVLRLVGTLGDPAYNLILHSAPLRERVDETYHWHWEIHPRLREIAGLELGTGLPVNPVAPEVAAQELLDTAREEKIETGVAVGPRSWDEFGPR